MSSQRGVPSQRKRWQPSLDEWAVIAALVVALLVRLGILRQVSW